ncbi:unnamed protein product [Malus baccata var. baccata]
MLTWLNRDHKNRRARGGYQNRRPENPKVQGRRGRGRLRKTLEETLRKDLEKDLEYLDLTEDMTQNQAQWRSRIHIADPT